MNELTFDEVFDKYIKDQKIISEITVRPSKHYTNAVGILCENGYKYVTQGGCCHGDDCNTTWILDENNKIIISKDW